jgi:hypothetical protein
MFYRTLLDIYFSVLLDLAGHVTKWSWIARQSLSRRSNTMESPTHAC